MAPQGGLAERLEGSIRGALSQCRCRELATGLTFPLGCDIGSNGLVEE
jgi:hypothetical protein